MPEANVAAPAAQAPGVTASTAVNQDPPAGGAAPGAAQPPELQPGQVAPAAAPEHQPQPQTPQEPAEPGGVERRISELTRKRREAERRAQEAEAQAAAAFEALQRLQAPAQPAAEPDLQPPVFETPEQFARDMAAYAEQVAERRAKTAAQQQREQEAREASQRAMQAEQERVRSTFIERVEQARAKLPDYDEVANNPDVPVSVPLAAAIAQHPQGAEIAYHLGKHLDEAKRIYALPPMLQVAELGVLAYKLANPPVAPTSKAAPPIEPVRGPATASAPDLSEVSMEEYAARRGGKR